MTITVSASSLVKTSFNFTETQSSTIRSENESLTSNRAYTYGSGNFEIDAAVKTTGVLPSGGSVIFDVTSMSNTSFGITSTVAFSGVKTIQGRDINIRATGANAFTNIFNGGSGNLLIKPYSSFTYSDPYRLSTSSTQKNISLFDVSGSGATYEICVLGNLT